MYDLLSTASRNLLLGSLAKADLENLVRHGGLVDFKQGDVLVQANASPHSFHFPISGIVSIVATPLNGKSYEVGMYGREGVGPISAVRAETWKPNAHIAQADGTALRLDATKLPEVMDANPDLLRLIRLFGDALAVQIGYTAMANGSLSLAKRLARWLLMYDDRVDGDLLIDDNFLSILLGSGDREIRAVKTSLQNDGFIRSVGPRIRIVDRDGLAHFVGGSYGIPEAEYRRLMGHAIGLIAAGAMSVE